MLKSHKIFILKWVLKALNLMPIRDLQEKIVLETKIEYLLEDIEGESDDNKD